VLADYFREKPFPTLGYHEYIELLADFLERLSPHIVIQRLFAAAPDDILIAPVWDKTRSQLLNDLDACLEKRGSFQGKKLRALRELKNED